MHYLKHNDIELPFTIDFAVIKTISEKKNIKLSEFEKTVDDPILSEIVLFEALKRGHKIEKKSFEIKEDDVTDILSGDGNYYTFLQAFGKDVLRMFSAPQQSSKKK